MAEDTSQAIVPASEVDARAVRNKSLRVVAVVFLLAGYLLGLLFSNLMLWGFPPEGDLLAKAATAMILEKRGFPIDPSARFSEIDCLQKSGCTRSPGGKFTYVQVVDYNRSNVVSVRNGETICNTWLLDPITRGPCLEFGIEVPSMTGKELDTVLDVISHPCRYREKAHVNLKKAFRCLGDVAMMRPRVLVFLHTSNASSFQTRIEMQ